MLHSRTNGGALKPNGFTLVELLVVITIIGILVGMLMPAVNSPRESGRNVTCKNNLNQLGKAMLAHENAQEMFPTGGWGWSWVGDPDHGYGNQQPGGWIYNILPHTEMNALHDLGRYGTNSAKQTAILQMVGTPLNFTNCPTRRRDATFINANATPINNAGGVPVTNTMMVARTDYAVLVGTGSNAAGTSWTNNEIGGGPGVGADAFATNGSLAATASAAQASYFGTRATGNTNFYNYTGICFEQSTIRKDDVTDGLSQTIMLGEKYLGQDNYGTGGVGADNENEYVGMDNDIGRVTYIPPLQDRWGLNNTCAFGSSHPNSANFVFCDGSVLSISYQINVTTFQELGSRSEGVPVDMTQVTGNGG